MQRSPSTSGNDMKLGRTPSGGTRLRLQDYLTNPLPAPPHALKCGPFELPDPSNNVYGDSVTANYIHMLKVQQMAET